MSATQPQARHGIMAKFSGPGLSFTGMVVVLGNWPADNR